MATSNDQISGVQPVSIPHIPFEAPVRTIGEWGQRQRQRSTAGYDDQDDDETKQQPAGAPPSGLIRDWRRPAE